ncbi:MAG: FKBP-type peptidyl-prolyl cis-trans isomerase [Isosphaeraceae bacterium]|nr:FKBP-type peptidyl-prolyl cis-trans isomerase [Isosphaeraceae bacterium]
MQRWHGLLWGVVGLALAGCEEPTQIVTATPPGGTIDRLPEAEKGDKGPQALGEQVVAKKGGAKEPIPPAKPTEKGEAVTTTKGLKYETLKEGTGEEVKSGQTVVMSYIGKFDDGTVFDQSSPDKPFETVIGVQQVIDGWDQGVIGMRVGERRRLIVPPELGYGATGKGKVPPNARLTFEVELLKVK